MKTMHHFAVSLAAAIMALLPASVASNATAAVATSPAEPARVIVKFKADSPMLSAQSLSATALHTARAQALGQRMGLSLRSGAGVANRMQVVMADTLSSAQLAARLSQQADVEYAVVDERRHRATAPSDPLYASGLGGQGPTVGQWYLRAPSGAVQSSVNVEPAWALSPNNAGVVVAVLDTGVRYDHADLMTVALGGNLLPGYDMITDVATANDGTGRDADASDPGDWVTLAESSQAGCSDGPVGAQDSSWHGTQTAGLIGALTDNGIGMASVGRTVQILPVRVLGKCGGYDSDIMAGMLWAAGISVSGVSNNAHPAKIINMSLGGDGACSQAYRDVISRLTDLNVVVVASAGNSAGHAPSVPANCPGVIAVAGLRHVGTKVGFSDLGPDIALSAPAGNCINTASNQPCLYPILTTTNGGTTTPVTASSVYTDSYNASLGTSFSAPLVSGTVALMLSVQPGLTPPQVRAILTGSARPFPSTGGDSGDGRCVAPTSADQAQCYCTTATCGAGMLDTGAAVQAASAGLQAQIGFSKTGAHANQALTLSGASSWATAGRTITAYQWTLADGGGIVSAPTGSTTDSTLVVTPSAAGQFTVSLTVTDNLNGTSTSAQTIDVLAALPPAAPSTGGGGGGGALEPTSLLMLLATLIGARTLRQRKKTQP